MNTIKKFLSNATNISIAEVTAANFVKAGIGFVTSIIVFRYFNETEIANIYILVSIMLISQQFGDMGITGSFVHIASPMFQKEKTEYYKFSKSVFFLKLLIVGLIVFFGYFLSSWLSIYLFSSINFIWWVRLTFIFSAIAILGSYFSSLLEIEQKFRLSAVLKIFPPLIKFIFILLIIYLSLDSFENLFYGFMLLPLAAFTLNFFYIDKNFFTYANDWLKDLKKLYSFSMWLTLAALMGTLFSQIDIIMLKKISTDYEVAIFTGGQRIASLFLLISQAIFTVLLPKVANYESSEQLWKFWKKCIYLGFLLIAPLVPLLLLAPYFVPFLLGIKYEPSVLIFQLISLQFCAITVSSTLTLILFNRRKVHIISIVSAIQFVFNVVLNFYWIQKYGAVGATFSSTILCYMALTVFAFIGYLEIKRMSE